MDLHKSSLKLFGAKFGTAAIQFLGVAVFANILNASSLGVFFLFQALLGMIGIFADFGLRGALEKRVSEGESEGTYLSSALLLKLFPIVVISMILLLAQNWIDNYVGSDVTILLIVAIILYELAYLAIFILRGELRVGEIASLHLSQEVIWLAVGTVLLFAGWGEMGLILALMSGLLFAALWGWSKVSVSLAAPSGTHARSLFSYGKFNFVSSLGGYFYSWMDIVIIGLLLSQAAVGVYEVAWRVSAIALLFSTAIGTTIFPQISNLGTNDKMAEIESLITKAITPSLIFVIPSFFGTLILAEEILSLVFGTEFGAASGVLIILAGEKIIQAIHIILGRVLKALDKPNLTARATIISVLLNLILNFLFISVFGIIGAAMATALSFVTNTFFHAVYVNRFVNIRVPIREISWCVIASLLMSGCVLLVKNILVLNTIPRLFFAIGVGGVCYGLFLWAYSPIRERIVSTVRHL
jgi:O-antigen/teichoic acid export membrane protein